MHGVLDMGDISLFYRCAMCINDSVAFCMRICVPYYVNKSVCLYLDLNFSDPDPVIVLTNDQRKNSEFANYYEGLLFSSPDNRSFVLLSPQNSFLRLKNSELMLLYTRAKMHELLLLTSAA